MIPPHVKMDKSAPVPAIVWVVLLALLVVATFYEVSPAFVFATGAWFGVWEYAAVDNKHDGDTFTEFQRDRWGWPVFRWLMGLWVCWIVIVRVPEPWSYWLIGPFFTWYPIHLAIPGIERRAWNRVKGWFG